MGKTRLLYKTNPASLCIRPLLSLLALALVVENAFAATQYSTRAAPDTTQLTSSQWWTDAEADPWPNPDDDYVFIHGVVRGPDGTMTFNGHSFQIGDDTHSVTIAAKEAGTVTYANEGLILVNGSYDHWSQGQERWIGGKVTVKSPKAKPFVFTLSHESNNGHALSGPLYGEAGTAIKATHGSHCPGYRFRYAGDISNYHGTFIIDKDVEFTCGDNNAPRVCPGTIEMGECAKLILPYTASSLSIADISFAKGSILHVRIGHDVDKPLCSTLTVTDSLTLPSEGRLKIEMNETLPVICKNGEAPKYEVLKVAQSVKTISLDDFELDPKNVDGINGNGFLPKDAKLVLDVDADGLQTLSIQPRRIVELSKNDSAGESAFLPKNADHWTGMAVNDPLSPDVDYLSQNKQLRSPEASNADCVFGGHSLTLDGGYLILKTKKTVVSNLTLRAGTALSNWGGAPATPECPGGMTAIGGKMSLSWKNEVGEWNGVSVTAQQGRGIIIASDISSQSNDYLNFVAAQDGTIPYYELAGDNSGFGGPVLVSLDLQFPEKAPVLTVSDGRNLGGPFYSGKFCFYGIWIRNQACLRAVKSLTVSEPTRGVYVHGTARFHTLEGVTMTIDGSPVTLNGCLTKEGAGTLALGGTLTFATENNGSQTLVAEPVAEHNLIHVAEGRLCALSTGAFAKAKISFGATGALSARMPTGGEDAAFAKYGALLTANDEPFAAGVVPVAVEGDAAAFGAGFEVPVFTVTKAAADGLSVTGIRPAKDYQLVAEMRENAGEDTVTCWATVSHVGMVILLK